MDAARSQEPTETCREDHARFRLGRALPSANSSIHKGRRNFFDIANCDVKPRAQRQALCAAFGFIEQGEAVTFKTKWHGVFNIRPQSSQRRHCVVMVQPQREFRLQENCGGHN